MAGNWWDNYADATASPLPSGATYTDPATGRPAVMQDGRPVLMGAQKLSPEDGATMKAVDDGSRSAATLDNEAQQFMAHNAKAATGPAFADMNLFGAHLNPLRAVAEQSPDFKAMEGLSIPAATSMRPPGGRMTQMEFQAFQKAVPSVANYGTGNEGAALNAHDAHTIAAAQSAFYHSWLTTHANLNGADQAWTQYSADRLPNFLRGPSGRASNAAPQAQQQAAPQPQPQQRAPTFGQAEGGFVYVGGKGSDPSDQRNWRPAAQGGR